MGLLADIDDGREILAYTKNYVILKENYIWANFFYLIFHNNNFNWLKEYLSKYTKIIKSKFNKVKFKYIKKQSVKLIFYVVSTNQSQNIRQSYV